MRFTLEGGLRLECTLERTIAPGEGLEEMVDSTHTMTWRTMDWVLILDDGREEVDQKRVKRGI